MVKNDDRKIWEALFENKKSSQDEEIINENPVAYLARMALPYAANAIQNFVMTHGQREKERRESDEEGSSCPTLDGLIRSANKEDEEDAEGREEIGIDDRPEAFEDIEAHTPL